MTRKQMKTLFWAATVLASSGLSATACSVSTGIMMHWWGAVSVLALFIVPVILLEGLL